jgi:hypothetical protein
MTTMIDINTIWLRLVAGLGLFCGCICPNDDIAILVTFLITIVYNA